MPPPIEEGSLPVSVVIPAHNRAHLIERTLGSVAAQRPLPPAEVILVDDASTDGTADAAERLGARVIRHDENRGASAARNTALRAATQPWIALLDSDDEWLPHHLDSLWGVRGDHVLVAGATVWLGPDGRPRRLSAPPKGEAGRLRSPAQLLFPENFIQPCAAMVRRDALEDVGGFDEDIRLVEDLDLWTRLLEAGSGYVIDRVVARYRVHEGQISVERTAQRAGHEEIARRYAGREWCPPRLLADMRAVTIWDDLRERLAQRDARGVLGEAARLAARPANAPALVRLWLHRRDVRRRARALAGQF
jgi:glycosyltransferase involved in cell wall biosynthesis